MTMTGKREFAKYKKETEMYLERAQSTEQRFREGKLSGRDYMWECTDRRNERRLLNGMAEALGLKDAWDY